MTQMRGGGQAPTSSQTGWGPGLADPGSCWSSIVDCSQFSGAEGDPGTLQLTHGRSTTLAIQS